MPNQAGLPSFIPEPCMGRVNDMKTPQRLSREAIEEFKAIYQDEFGETLSDDEVQEMAMRLLRFFGIMHPSGKGND